MDLYALITASRSFRSFAPNVRLPHALLLHLVACARLSPSSMNLQMLKFRLVETPEECNAMLAHTRWAGRIQHQQIPPKGHAPTAYVVICADTSLISTAERFQRDVGITAQSMMLAAREAGFGGCMIGSFDKKGVSDALSLPPQLPPQLVLALGKPDEEITLTDATEDIGYYRENGKHYVPKRSLDDLII